MANEVPQIDVKAAPVVIHLKSNQGSILGREFHVNDIGGWGYTGVGIQATGYFHGEPQAKLTIIVPLTSIDYIQPDLEALEQYETAEAAAEEPQPADDDDVDRGPAELQGEAEVGLTQEGLKTDGSEDR